MAVQTLHQKLTAALVHIVEEHLEAKGKLIETFFQKYGFTNPNDLQTTAGTDIKDFEFKDAAGVNKKLTPLDVNKIRAPIGDDDWITITMAELDAFRASDYCKPSESMYLRREATAELAALAAC